MAAKKDKAGKGGRTPDAEEEALWLEATSGIKKLPRGKEIPAAAPKRKPRRPAPESLPPPLPATPPRGREMDRRSAEKLAKGKMEIEARIDLHGMRAKGAQDALSGFIARASAAGMRCVLVITGKGGRAGDEGVLYKNVPLWLSSPPLSHLILRVTQAQPKHGGSGALYVLLRRRRD